MGWINFIDIIFDIKKNKEWKFVFDDKNNFLNDRILRTFVIEWLVLNVYVCIFYFVMRIVVLVNVYFFYFF